MKTRSSFVSNSSSSSFIIPLDHPVGEYIEENWQGQRIKSYDLGRFTGMCSGKGLEAWLASDDCLRSLHDRIVQAGYKPKLDLLDLMYIRESDEDMGGDLDEHLDLDHMKQTLSVSKGTNSEGQLIWDFESTYLDLSNYENIFDLLEDICIHEEEYH